MFNVNVKGNTYKFSGEIDIYDLDEFHGILTKLSSIPRECRFKIVGFHPSLEKMLTISGLSRYLM